MSVGDVTAYENKRPSLVPVSSQVIHGSLSAVLTVEADEVADTGIQRTVEHEKRNVA